VRRQCLCRVFHSLCCAVSVHNKACLSGSVPFIPTRSACLMGGAAIRHGGESTLVGKGLAVVHHSGVTVAQPPAPRLSRHYYSIVVVQLVGVPRLS
jgi:hypothetical protein